jgi:ketosteroid isomerase-like protein
MEFARRSQNRYKTYVSDSNIELHRRSVAAFNTRDVEAFVAFCDAHIELHSAVTVPGGAVYYGHEGVRRWYRDLAEGWGSDLWIEPERYFAVGESTITFHVLHGRGHASGADVAMHAAHLCRWSDGAMTYFRGYSHREDAFRDLGVSEGDLDPIAP